MKKEMIPKVIFRQKSELALNSPDRKNLNKIKVEKSVKNMLDYFSDEEKKVLHLTDYMIGAINKEETVNLVLEKVKYKIILDNRVMVLFKQNRNLTKKEKDSAIANIDSETFHYELDKKRLEFMLKIYYFLKIMK